MSRGRAAFSILRILSWAVFLAINSSVIAADSAIPKGYELVERTLSPNGRYGVLFPIASQKAGDDEEYPPNLLVQLQPYKVLAEISPGLPEDVTTDLDVEWSGNSTVAVHHFRRWGLVGLWFMISMGDRLAKVQDVLGPAREIFRQDFRTRFLARFPNEPEVIILVSSEGEENPVPDYRFKGRKLLLDLFADNKPNLAGGPHWSARLKAVWDLDAGKFRSVKLVPGPIEVRENP